MKSGKSTSIWFRVAGALPLIAMAPRGRPGFRASIEPHEAVSRPPACLGAGLQSLTPIFTVPDWPRRGQAMRQAGAVLRRHPTMRQCLRAARCTVRRFAPDRTQIARPVACAAAYCGLSRKRCLAGAGWEFSLAKLIQVSSALLGQRRSATAATPHKGSAHGLKSRAGLSTSSIVLAWTPTRAATWEPVSEIRSMTARTSSHDGCVEVQR